MAMHPTSSVLLVAFLFLCLICFPCHADDWSFLQDDDEVVVDPESDAYAFPIYQSWMVKHNRTWNSLKEMHERFMIFKDNLKYIETRNKEKLGHRLGLNAFADMTYEEFRKTHHGGFKQFHQKRKMRAGKSTTFKHANATHLPKSMDWRTKGAVAEVKDQGNCGSCWAFSSIAAVEAVNQIATGDLISLSEQELVDCDRAQNQGCNGGLMDSAFDFIISNGGVDTEKDYPYKGVDGVCDTNKKNSHVVSIDDFEDVPESNEEALLKAVANQPVSVAIDAGGRDFQLYDGGIMMAGSCGTELNHAVLAVGYGTEHGVDYWIVKNSWGADWGEKGYIKLQRGANKPDGICGINLMASYPIKTSSNPPSPPPFPPAPPAPATFCDAVTWCPPGTTCCPLFSLWWSCCPLESATCCNDQYHCCPSEYPICDLAAGTCRSSSLEKGPIGVPLLERVSAIGLHINRGVQLIPRVDAGGDLIALE